MGGGGGEEEEDDDDDDDGDDGDDDGDDDDDDDDDDDGDDDGDDDDDDDDDMMMMMMVLPDDLLQRHGIGVERLPLPIAVPRLHLHRALTALQTTAPAHHNMRPRERAVSPLHGGGYRFLLQTRDDADPSRAC
jgi:hypothetical protein